MVEKKNNDVCGKNRYKNMIKWLKENNDVCGKKRYKKKRYNLKITLPNTDTFISL